MAGIGMEESKTRFFTPKNRDEAVSDLKSMLREMPTKDDSGIPDGSGYRVAMPLDHESAESVNGLAKKVGFILSTTGVSSVNDLSTEALASIAGISLSSNDGGDEPLEGNFVEYQSSLPDPQQFGDEDRSVFSDADEDGGEAEDATVENDPALENDGLEPADENEQPAAPSADEATGRHSLDENDSSGGSTAISEDDDVSDAAVEDSSRGSEEDVEATVSEPAPEPDEDSVSGNETRDSDRVEGTPAEPGIEPETVPRVEADGPEGGRDNRGDEQARRPSPQNGGGRPRSPYDDSTSAFEDGGYDEQRAAPQGGARRPARPNGQGRPQRPPQGGGRPQQRPPQGANMPPRGRQQRPAQENPLRDPNRGPTRPQGQNYNAPRTDRLSRRQRDAQFRARRNQWEEGGLIPSGSGNNRVIVFTGAGGGVGKSTAAITYAQAATRIAGRHGTMSEVWLIETDYRSSKFAYWWNLPEEKTLMPVLRKIQYNAEMNIAYEWEEIVRDIIDATMVMKNGLRVVACPIDQGDDVSVKYLRFAISAAIAMAKGRSGSIVFLDGNQMTNPSFDAIEDKIYNELVTDAVVVAQPGRLNELKRALNVLHGYVPQNNISALVNYVDSDQARVVSEYIAPAYKVIGRFPMIPMLLPANQPDPRVPLWVGVADGRTKRGMYAMAVQGLANLGVPGAAAERSIIQNSRR